MTLATCQTCRTLFDASTMILREYVRCNYAECPACALGMPPTPGQVIQVRERAYARFPSVSPGSRDDSAMRIRRRRSDAFGAELIRLGWLRPENIGHATPESIEASKIARSELACVVPRAHE